MSFMTSTTTPLIDLKCDDVFASYNNHDDSPPPYTASIEIQTQGRRRKAAVSALKSFVKGDVYQRHPMLVLERNLDATANHGR